MHPAGRSPKRTLYTAADVPDIDMINILSDEKAPLPNEIVTSLPRLVFALVYVGYNAVRSAGHNDQRVVILLAALTTSLSRTGGVRIEPMDVFT